jgi:hypothetical protein
MPITRQQLSKFYADRKPYLDEIIGQDFAENPTIWSQFLNTKSASTGWIDTATVSGFGTFSSKTELEDAATDDIVQGPVARTTIVTYAKRHLVSQEAIEDDMGDGIIGARLPQMLKAGRATQEILGHSLLNNGFAGGGVTTPDTVALFSASHTNLMGGTYSNLLSSAADLAAGQLELAMKQLMQQVDDRSIPISQTPGTLVVGPNFAYIAKVLLGSSNVPGSAYNDINTMQNLCKLVVSPYITDEDSWFLLANDHALNFRWRVQPENWSEVDYRKSCVEVGVRFRCAVDALDPRSVIGTPGA